MADDEEFEGMSKKDIYETAFKQGAIEEQIKQVRQAQRDHVDSTDRRFLRLEDKIVDGFRQSQADREAGNKTLGDMINKTTEDLKGVVAQINKGAGALSATDKLIGVVIVFGAAALGGGLSHI
jgi:hypothetical protein